MGAARAGLMLFIVFVLMDLYTLFIVTIGSKSHFIGVLICIGFFVRIALVRYYFRPQLYTDLVTHYEQEGEPHRVQYALTGLCVLLVSMFLPFLILKVGR